jgi:hypothetical protein
LRNRPHTLLLYASVDSGRRAVVRSGACICVYTKVQCFAPAGCYVPLLLKTDTSPQKASAVQSLVQPTSHHTHFVLSHQRLFIVEDILTDLDFFIHLNCTSTFFIIIYVHTFDLYGWLSLGNVHFCSDYLVFFNRLCVVSRGRNIASSAGPVDVNVLAFGVILVGVLGLNPEGMCTEVVTLGLEKVGGQVLGAVSVVEAQSSAESRSGNTP